MDVYWIYFCLSINLMVGMKTLSPNKFWCILDRFPGVTTLNGELGWPKPLCTVIVDPEHNCLFPEEIKITSVSED